jgi:hypothetical protein
MEGDGSNDAAEYTGVVVGWTHNDLPNSINLHIQSAASNAALRDQRIDSHHFLMTRNQALLLAKYLLEATGQTISPRPTPTIWQRIRSRRAG